MNVTLAPGILDELIVHARTGLPNEACGLVVGRNRVGERFVPMVNTLASSTAYEMSPAELINTFRDLRNSGEDVVAIFHSHPAGAAYPSPLDVQKAYYPQAAHIIASMERAETPVVRAFQILEGEILEIELRAIV